MKLIAVIAALAAFAAALKLGWEWHKALIRSQCDQAYRDGFMAGMASSKAHTRMHWDYEPGGDETENAATPEETA